MSIRAWTTLIKINSNMKTVGSEHLHSCSLCWMVPVCWNKVDQVMCSQYCTGTYYQGPTVNIFTKELFSCEFSTCSSSSSSIQWNISCFLKVVAPTISSPVCQEQLIEAGKLVAKSVEGCVESSQSATHDEGLLKQVGQAASGVTQALNELLQHIRQYASGGHPIGRHGEATDRILDVTENIFSSMGDAGEWMWSI